MELKQFVDELKARMNVQIESISMDQADPLARTSHLIAFIESYIGDLKQFVIKYKFKDQKEEIEFFKCIKPGFVSQLLFNQRLFRIQLFEAFNDKESKIKFYQKNLNRIQIFLERNMEFYQYVLSNQDHMDGKYFLRINGSRRTFDVDDRFSTFFDIKLCKILCNQWIKEYLLKTAQKLHSDESSNSVLTWTASKTDLVELVYALHVLGVFNKGSADVKQIATHFENVFNVTLGNYYRTFQEIRIRKTGQVNFINQLKEGLLKLITERDS